MEVDEANQPPLIHFGLVSRANNPPKVGRTPVDRSGQSSPTRSGRVYRLARGKIFSRRREGLHRGLNRVPGCPRHRSLPISPRKARLLSPLNDPSKVSPQIEGSLQPFEAIQLTIRVAAMPDESAAFRIERREDETERSSNWTENEPSACRGLFKRVKKFCPPGIRG